MSRITVAVGATSLRAGDLLTMEVRDQNKWRRFKAWVLRRKPPMKLVQFVVTGQFSDTTLNTEPRV